MAITYIEYTDLLSRVQKFLAENHPDALKDSEHYDQIKAYVRQYIHKNGLYVEGLETDDVVDSLYSEMVEYSFLTPYMEREDVDEININAWDDVVVSYSNGRMEKIGGFFSPKHAYDIVRKMLNHSHSQMDGAIPYAEGQLPNNARITAMMTPLVDKDIYVAASIRMLHPSKITITNLVEGESASEDMLRFLCACMRYGVSFVVAGATFSGKTTLLNAMLKTMPDERRIYTIEAGTRELDLVRRTENTSEEENAKTYKNVEVSIVNNVVHTLARRSDKAAQDISMEDLVVAALRFNPDLIVLGEMRDEEAMAAIDASLTGHTLVSTIHSFAGEEAHMRLATLCQKRFPMGLEISLMQAAKAFPVVCFEQKLDDGSRKIMNITECEVDNMGRRKYHTLFRYVVESNEYVDGKLQIHGHYEAVEPLSNSLRERMVMFGIPADFLHQLENIPRKGR